MSKRATVKLTGDSEADYEIIQGSRNPDWEYIKQETIDNDLEKSCETIRVVLREKKGEKRYFEFEYRSTPYHELYDSALANDQPLVGEEVFPIKEITTVYK